jgi:hypothetical protein
MQCNESIYNFINAKLFQFWFLYLFYIAIVL